MKRKRILFFIAGGILVVAATMLLFLLRSRGGLMPAPASEKTTIPASSGARPEAPPIIEGNLVADADVRANNKATVYEETKGKTGFFGTSIQLPAFAWEVLSPLVPYVKMPEKPKGKLAEPGSGPAAPAMPGGVPPLTPQEVFDALYPVFFIDGLKDVQGQLMTEGIIAASQESAFAKEADIKSFMIVTAEYLASKGFIDEIEFSAFSDSISDFFDRPYEAKFKEASDLLSEQPFGSGVQFTFPDRAEALEEFYRTSNIKEGLPQDALELLPHAESESERRNISGEGAGRICAVAASDSAPRRLSAPLLRGLMLFGSFFSIPSAQAACGPTYCRRTPKCFMEGAGTAKGGSDFIIPCCSGRICGAPFGCLELCGNGSKPFIWDSATNICAC